MQKRVIVRSLPNQEKMSSALGIDDKRAGFLLERVEKVLAKSNSLSEGIEMFTLETEVTATELGFVCWIMGGKHRELMIRLEERQEGFIKFLKEMAAKAPETPKKPTFETPDLVSGRPDSSQPDKPHWV